VTLGWQGCHTRAHFYRSLLEGIAFELRSQLDGLERARGQHVDVIRAMGGGARSALWTQILANVFDRPLEVCASGEVSALGAAAIALHAIGVHPSLPEAAAAVHRTDAVIEPSPRDAQQYAVIRPIYERVYRETREPLHALHDLPDVPPHDQSLGDSR
jgi:xylulokinase